MRVLITAGPTQEPIDDVRYITDASSGKTGVALAKEAILRGHDVTLVHGPVSINLPNCKKIGVRTTQGMLGAVIDELNDCGVFISTAAVSDYTPKKESGKIRSGQELGLTLIPTPKIIDEVRKAFPDLFIVGFKAEFGLSRDELKAKAKEFLVQKKPDIVVANDIEKDAFGSDVSDVVIVDKETTKEFGRKPKDELAYDIWNEIELRKQKVCPS